MRILKYFIYTAAIAGVISCGGDRQKQKETRTVFRYNESKGIASLDPAFAKAQTTIWPVNQLFNGLVQMDEKLNILPCIAKSWAISEDGKVYTFYLHDDIVYHDHEVFKEGKGRAVVASDFVYSLNRIKDQTVASPGAWIFNNIDGNRTEDQTGFYAINDTTLQIFLKRPFPAFLGLLTMQYCSVVPQEVVKHYGRNFGRHPIGTGPFKFKLWKEGEKLVFRKNDHYFEKDDQGQALPYLDAVAITFINDKQSEFLEFAKGNVDFLSGVHAGNKDELLTRSGKLNPKYNGKFKMFTQPYLNTEYLAFLMDTSLASVQNSPLKIRAVRQAINYGFDRQKMMTYLRNNIGSPATAGFVPKGMPGFSEKAVKGYEYNQDKARELLNRAGYPNGEGLQEIMLTTTSDYLDLCEYIQHELSQIGLKISIDVNTGVTYRDLMANSKLNFFRGSWVADYPDPENYLALFYSKNFCPAGPNYTHFSSKKYDELYDKAMNELNDSLRYNYYHQMDRIIIEEAVVVPLFYDQVVRFTKQNIEGLEGNPMNLLTLKKVKKIKQ